MWHIQEQQQQQVGDSSLTLGYGVVVVSADDAGYFGEAEHVNQRSCWRGIGKLFTRIGGGGGEERSVKESIYRINRREE